MTRILIIASILLVLIIGAEAFYLFYYKPSTQQTQRKLPPVNLSPTQSIQPTQTVEALLTDIPQQASAETLSKFPYPTSTPTQQLSDQITVTTKKIYNIVRSSASLTKSTKLIQEYEGKIAELENINEDMYLEVYDETFTMKLKLGIQPPNENPKILYYTQKTLDNMRIYDKDNKLINLQQLKIGDNIRMNVTYNIDNNPPAPDSINITKLNN